MRMGGGQVRDDQQVVHYTPRELVFTNSTSVMIQFYFLTFSTQDYSLVFGVKMKEMIKTLLSPIMVTLKKGPLAGHKWILASGTRFIQGRYEPGTIKMLDSLIESGQTVYDVGAHVGYLTVYMSRLVGDSGQVIAFEPRPLNLIYLKRHISKNNIRNVRILEAGVSDHKGAGKFDRDHGTGTGMVSDKGDLDIDLVVLDELVKDGSLPPPNLIKMDIEGGEVQALPGAQELLKKYRPAIVLSTHGKEVHKFCIEFLESIGYTIKHEGHGGLLAI